MTGRRNLCTTAFVVTNGETQRDHDRGALPGRAHLSSIATASTVTLPMIGSWGAAYQDVQINGSPDSPEPLFYSNRGAGSLRRLASWRKRRRARAPATSSAIMAKARATAARRSS